MQSRKRNLKSTERSLSPFSLVSQEKPILRCGIYREATRLRATAVGMAGPPSQCSQGQLHTHSPCVYFP